mmetsp:Transcript_46664/g.77188  ORF Transcript_46664/g.77188 Transcript_46664/m.77188 type:complete len:152 (-) Transcript_46664:406-861(-)
MVKRGGIVKRPPRQAGRATINNVQARKPKVQQVKQAKQQATKTQAGVGGGSGRHTLLLIQDLADKRSRSWSDYASLPQALDAFVSLYENQLRTLNPQAKQLSYTVQDLHVYVDSLFDLSAMVLDPSTKQYQPRGKDFLKAQMLQRLKSSAV